MVIIHDGVELGHRGFGEVPPFGGHPLVVDIEKDGTAEPDHRGESAPHLTNGAIWVALAITA